MGRIKYDHFKVATDDRNMMEFWWGKLSELNIEGALGSIHLPETHIVYPQMEGLCAIASLSESNDQESMKLAKVVFDLVKRTAHERKLQYPLFMRTSLGASKHEWKDTCFIKDESKLSRNLRRMLENQLLELMARQPEVIFLREFMELRVAFRAFEGKMPIAREFRVFSGDGKLLHIQPYWLHDAIHSPDVEDWESRLSEINKLDSGDESFIVDVANQITKHIGDSWSVDFCQLMNGVWAITDMALALASFIYNPYQEDWRQTKPSKEELEWLADYETPRMNKPADTHDELID